MQSLVNTNWNLILKWIFFCFHIYQRSEKEKLLQNHNQLKLSIEDVRQNLSGLCQSLSTDGAPQSEQLQALARYFSSDCPTSVLLTPMASPSLAGPDQDTHANSSLDTFLADTCPEGDTVALRSPTAFLQDNVQSTVTDPAPWCTTEQSSLGMVWCFIFTQDLSAAVSYTFEHDFLIRSTFVMFSNMDVTKFALLQGVSYGNAIRMHTDMFIIPCLLLRHWGHSCYATHFENCFYCN